MIPIQKPSERNVDRLFGNGNIKLALGIRYAVHNNAIENGVGFCSKSLGKLLAPRGVDTVFDHTARIFCRLVKHACRDQGLPLVGKGQCGNCHGRGCKAVGLAPLCRQCNVGVNRIDRITGRIGATRSVCLRVPAFKYHVLGSYKFNGTRGNEIAAAEINGILYNIVTRALTGSKGNVVNVHPNGPHRDVTRNGDLITGLLGLGIRCAAYHQPASKTFVLGHGKAVFGQRVNGSARQVKHGIHRAIGTTSGIADRI